MNNFQASIFLVLFHIDLSAFEPGDEHDMDQMPKNFLIEIALSIFFSSLI